MLQSSINKLLESLKGEINAAARSCSAACMEEILQACFDSAEEAVDGSRSAAAVLIRPDAANSTVMVRMRVCVCACACACVCVCLCLCLQQLLLTPLSLSHYYHHRCKNC